MYIYGILNKINHKMYIGYNSYKYDIDHYRSRPQRHLAGTGGCKTIWKEIQEQGKDNFLVIKIHQEPNCTIEKLKQLEIYYIKHFGTLYPLGYNRTVGGDGATGCKNSDETKKKKSTSAILANTPEVRKKKSISGKIAQNNPEVKNRVVVSSITAQNLPEVKKHNSEMQLIAQNRPEVIEKKSKSMLGKNKGKNPFANKTDAEMLIINEKKSNSLKGRNTLINQTAEEKELWKQNLSKSHKGRNLGKTYEEIYGEEKAKEIKDKKAFSMKDYIPTTKTLEKISNSNKLYYENNPEAKERIGDFFRGKPISEEHKLNISKGSRHLNNFEDKTENEMVVIKQKISDGTKKAMTDLEIRQKCAISGKRTSHKRYHKSQNMINLSCDFCREEENEFNGC